MSFLYPTERQVCRTLLNAIATHPLIKDPQIFYPAVIGNRPITEPLKINKWRLFGGTELIEEGLTLAIFPTHSAFKVRSSSYTTGESDKSMEFGTTDYRSELGGSNVANSGGVLRLTIQLYYREPSLDVPIQIKSDLVSTNDITVNTPHGEQVQVTDEYTLKDLEDKTPYNVDRNVLDVQILPGEEVLRDYIPLLRLVVRDIQVLQPYYVRNPLITAVDYPTSNWLREGENLVFHTAYIMVEYDISEPGLRRPGVGFMGSPYQFPNPRNITVDDQRGDKYHL